ncbi:hypothetical protein N9M21_04675, partial [Alphaproteobacteria bacterium]|nr:hypothetical protein [Alphaproteobacteria bacterium]
MWVVHLINRSDPSTDRINERFAGLTLDEEQLQDPNHRYSCCWNFKLEEAERLEGGMVYMHRTKKDLSSWAGKVVDVLEVDVSVPEDAKLFPHVESGWLKPKKLKRVTFILEYDPQGVGIAWRGQSHRRAWSSGIIEVDTDY